MSVTTIQQAPGTTSSANISQLPDWYTNYAKNVTNLGTSLLGSLPGYNGYTDANGNPIPMTAGLSGAQQQGIDNAKSSVGSFAPGMAAAGSTVGNGINTVQGASTNFGQAGNAYGSALGTINTGLGQVAGASGAIGNMGGALQQAQGFLNPSMQMTQQGASGSEFSPNAMSKYMNPYTQGVVQNLQTLSNRNLTENVLPAVNSTFTGAGQFGSTRNGEFESRAIRDNQTALNGQIANTLSDAQNQALNQASLASNRDLQAGSQIGALSGLATGVASGYSQQAGTQIQQGNATLNGAQGQIQTGSGLNALGNSQVNQGQVLGQLGQTQANQADMTHQMQLGDTQALMGVGAAQQNTNQAGLTAAYQDYLQRLNYPTQQLGALSGILGNVSGKVTPNTESTQVYAPQSTDPLQSLSDLAGGLSQFGG